MTMDETDPYRGTDAYIEQYIEDLDQYETAWPENSSPTRYDGSIDFSTPTSTYHLIPGRHSRSTDVDDTLLEDVDAYVLETGARAYRDLDLEHLLAHQQYEETIETLIDEETPIYFVDLTRGSEDFADEQEYDWHTTKVKALEGAGRYIPLAAGMFLEPTGLPLALPMVSGIAGLAAGKQRHIDQAISYGQLSGFYLPSAGRSATAAEKIDRFIAPKIGTEQGEQPDIAIEFGGGHCDIKPYLEHPRLRAHVLDLHERFGHWPHSEKHKDTIEEISFSSDMEDGNEIQLDDGYEATFHRFEYTIDDLG